MGLFEELKKSNKIAFIPNKFDLVSLSDIIMTALKNQKVFRQPTIYTSRTGGACWDFSAEVSVLYPGLKYWVYIPKNPYGVIYISLFEKHGLYKLKIDINNYDHKYEVIHGTTVLIKMKNLAELKAHIQIATKNGDINIS